MEATLAAADRSIWIEYYMIRNDQTGQRFLDFLAAKASAGAKSVSSTSAGPANQSSTSWISASKCYPSDGTRSGHSILSSTTLHDCYMGTNSHP